MSRRRLAAAHETSRSAQLSRPQGSRAETESSMRAGLHVELSTASTALRILSLAHFHCGRQRPSRHGQHDGGGCWHRRRRHGSGSHRDERQRCQLPVLQSRWLLSQPLALGLHPGPWWARYVPCRKKQYHYLPQTPSRKMRVAAPQQHFAKRQSATSALDSKRPDKYPRLREQRGSQLLLAASASRCRLQQAQMLPRRSRVRCRSCVLN